VQRRSILARSIKNSRIRVSIHLRKPVHSRQTCAESTKTKHGGEIAVCLAMSCANKSPDPRGA
jgi:hypothetical protein